MTEGYDPQFDFATGAEVTDSHWVAWILAGGEPIKEFVVDAWIATVPSELQ